MTNERPVLCPSGLHLVVREMTGREIQKIMSEQGDEDDGVKLLEQCVVKVVDRGPLFKGWKEGEFIVDDLVLGDIVVSMIGIRCATFVTGEGGKSEIDLEMVCPYCSHHNVYTVDLAARPVKPMDPEAIERLVKDEPFEIKVRGKTVKWLPARRREQRKIAKMAKLDTDQRYALAASLRIREIEGVHANDKLKWLTDLGAGTMAQLNDLMDYFDGGIDTDEEFRCGNLSCKGVVHAEIPLDQRLFTPPKARWKKTHKRPDLTVGIG